MLGVVTGLAFEQRLVADALAGLAADVRCAGSNAGRASALAQDLADAGAKALLSIGIAGALDPKLASGALVLVTGTIDSDGERLGTDPGLMAWLKAELGPAADAPAGLLYSSPSVLIDPAAKAEARKRYGADVVDIESHAIARVGRAQGLPTLIIRSIADRAQDRLPAIAATSTAADGSLLLMATLKGLAVRPGDWGPALRAGRGTRSAVRSLSDLASTLRRLVGFLG